MEDYELLAENKVDEQNTPKSPGDIKERRREQRLYYRWPIWLSKEKEEAAVKPDSIEAQMVDVSSSGAAFTFQPDKVSLQHGQEITTRFRIPRFGASTPFNTVLFTRIGRISRIQYDDNSQCKAAVTFNRPLYFEPGEQGLTGTEVKQQLRAYE